MKHIFTAVLLTAILSVAALAQSAPAGSVRGTVVDQNGDVVTGARVELREIRTSTKNIYLTDSSGGFTFKDLAPGRYEITVDANGFGRLIKPLLVASSAISGLELRLSVGETHLVVSAEIGGRQERQNIPQAVNIISAERILERSTSVLAQVGKEEAGLNVQMTSPTIGAIVVRGLTGKNVVNYIDGVRYTNGAQRGGINTFFNLNDGANLSAIEVLRGPNGAQYGSDSLGGTVNMVTKFARFGDNKAEFHGEFNPSFTSANNGFGSSAFLSYGTNKLGGYVSLSARRANPLRTAKGLDTHSAITRYLGLPSNVLYDRSPDTGFTQYGGATRINYAPRSDSQFIFYYQRGQQDGGKRFDQLLGGDGNLIADLRNLMLDFGYARFVKQRFGWFDSASFTVSYNSQREERVNQGGQGNPFADITHQYERTSTTGFSFFLDKQLPKRNTFLFGGDFYGEQINSPAFIVNPVTNVTTISRPRVPDEARFNSAGLFIQNAWQAIPDRLRITGALRYGGVHYSAKGSDSPIVGGRALWASDSLRVADWSGRVGMVARLAQQFRLAFNYGRGFRYPSMTDLGTLGLTGDGFEVDYLASQRLSGTIGTTAGSDAVSTGIPVSKQRSETSQNFDFSVRYENRRFDTEFTAFVLDINSAITKQSLILPAGSVGQFLGSEPIISQLPSGVVFVGLSTAPVLVRANYTDARLYGFEYEAEGRINDNWSARGNITYIHSADKANGVPPNIEGGTPPPNAFLSLKYNRSKFWVEFYSTIAAKQDRLSSLDLSDRRTGSPRSRSQIENYFRRGACVQGLTSNAAGTCNGNVNTYTLLPTGENITQVLTRVLGPGFVAAPMFTSLPGYGLANIRGGINAAEKVTIFWAFENMFDQQYRNPSWGVDGAGRSFTAQLRYRF
ncbi:MAG TPA: TonB-dependent receptor [Pyrinomonadaceae bacterium]|nr:TonB-dependent receptor [Chloracidobacterium sp.]MBP9934819.1 TonB-dependent receptor [Pyrinomonadaceae bacterium]MBK9767605.1 TonB-dependent receptor [Chloracidobacterium sp.]MBL0240922.1 TonB-dependent receptor [Chloracidobacterium sp.]HQX56043.1 TonB-dependent receptor [Pyrinomonadaceae bacterium]